MTNRPQWRLRRPGEALRPGTPSVLDFMGRSLVPEDGAVGDRLLPESPDEAAAVNTHNSVEPADTAAAHAAGDILIEPREAAPDTDLIAVATTRKRLYANGYRPIPVLSHTDPHPKDAGKAPLGKAWQKAAQQTPPEIVQFGRALAIATNTGIWCGGLRVFDFDLDDSGLANAAEELAIQHLGPAPTRRRNNSDHFAMVYRAAAGEPPKRVITGSSHSKVYACKIEVLGHGQQLVAYGTHATGGTIYWSGPEPVDMPRDQLPAVTEEQITAFFAAVAPLIGAPHRLKANGASTGGAATADLAALAAALNLIPADVADDREQWIRVGTALYHASAGSDAGMELWADWAAKSSSKFDPGETAEKWGSFADYHGTPAGAGTVFALATPYGWHPPDPLDDPGYVAALEAAATRTVNGPLTPEPISSSPEAEAAWRDTDPNRAPEDDPRPHDDTPTKPVLQLRYGFDALAPQPLGTVVDGILHAGSVTLIYGPPKGGKSFLATDMALSVADRRPDWMGHVVVRPGPVLYVACEGHAGFWKRLAAAAKTRGWDRETYPKGFILATGRPLLIKADARGMTYAPDPSSILAALADARQRGLNPVAIIIDTVFRSFGAGNVNASPDMNVYLACVAVMADQGYAVALVHHEIKSGGTPAGSVSLIGGSDNIVHVWRESPDGERRLWQVEMAKDDAETAPRAFTLEVIPVGLDPDGRPAASCVIRDAGDAPDATAQRKPGRPRSDNSEAAILAALVYDELCNLQSDPRAAEEVSIHPESPPVRAVSRMTLRATIIQAGILVAATDEADRKRVTKSNDRQLQRAINLLKRQRKIVANAQWVGLLQ